MRVVLDGVFNHASRGFFQFSHILEERGQSHTPTGSPSRTIHSTPTTPTSRPTMRAGRAERAPRFRVATPAVREFLLSVGEHWMRGRDRRLAAGCRGGDRARLWREFDCASRQSTHRPTSWPRSGARRSPGWRATRSTPQPLSGGDEPAGLPGPRDLDLKLAHEVWGMAGWRHVTSPPLPTRSIASWPVSRTR